MTWASVLTMPFGLTEPLFVPRYWNPPSLFDLAQRTGFDIESLIFCFAIGGVGTILYNIVTGRNLQPLGPEERKNKRHHYHRAALVVPIMAFTVLWLTPLNPIYAAIVSMAFGGAATVVCRPDLKLITLIGGVCLPYTTPSSCCSSNGRRQATSNGCGICLRSPVSWSAEFHERNFFSASPSAPIGAGYSASDMATGG